MIDNNKPLEARGFWVKALRAVWPEDEGAYASVDDVRCWLTDAGYYTTRTGRSPEEQDVLVGLGDLLTVKGSVFLIRKPDPEAPARPKPAFRHLLFQPSAAYREWLLKEGAGGARPPVRWIAFGEESGAMLLNATPVPWNEGGRPQDADWTALVLVWDHAPANEGIDRLLRVGAIADVDGFGTEFNTPAVLYGEDGSHNPMFVRWIRNIVKYAEVAGLGTAGEIPE